jgi:hypothetical protein
LGGKNFAASNRLAYGSKRLNNACKVLEPCLELSLTLTQKLQVNFRARKTERETKSFFFALIENFFKRQKLKFRSKKKLVFNEHHS